MVHFKLWEILVIYLIGGKIILIIFTAIRHQSLTSFYGRKIIMRPGSPFKEPDTGSWNFPITVTNNSNVIIKNVHALITIEYDKTDIREDPDFLMYGKYPSGHPLPIFWSPYPDDGVRESRDIEVGVTATFQVFRRHLLTDEEHLLQVPSINDSIGKEPACLILDGAEEYDFAVTVIVDNPLFITRHYRFNTNWANMLETENGGLMEGQHNPIRNYISFLQFNGSNPDLIELF